MTSRMRWIPNDSNAGGACASKIPSVNSTIISPGAVITELPNTITDPAAAQRVRDLYANVGIPADSFARVVAFAISQPEDVDINEILFRPTRQEY